MPPIAAPQGVAWKQEAREQRLADGEPTEPVETAAAAVETPAPETKPPAPESKPEEEA
jgi:hypothetical protein